MENIKITFAENGTKTLATAGKYCDRNVDIEVNVAGGVEVEPIVLSGSCSYACSGALATNYIKLFGDTISTKNLGNILYMFQNSSLTHVPFALNFSTSTNNITAAFLNATALEAIPEMHNLKLYNSADEFANGCVNLATFPEDFGADWDFSRIHTEKYGATDYMFYNCKSLRRIPQAILENMYCATNSAYSGPYYNSYYGCISLDEIKGLAVPPITYTSNMFVGTAVHCCRLKDFTFVTNEDGTPKTANWKSQVITLTAGLGYATGNSAYSKEAILNANNTITADKEVTDDATYQALKDDPDWFTSNIAYSRYNHDSAVNTINSLPDTSAYLATAGGTNTIQFYTNTGELTDGGAISKLTEEEIAVAAAKGWTVTFY